MCEMYIRVVDKNNTNPYLDAKCTKRGDVIVVVPDGWGWSTIERADPNYRIVKVPGITVDEAAAFVASEIDVDPANPSRVLQRRGFRIDLTGLAISQAWITWIADNTRAVPTRTLAITLAQLQALKIKKPTLIDPNILSL